MAQRTSLIVIDDFYANPIEVRNFALNQKFNITGNFPGFRTKSLLNDTIKEAIQCIIGPFAGEIVDWFDDGAESSCGAFQYTTEEHHSWIHTDGAVRWAGVLYLTPNAPPSSGTGFYKHKKTGLEKFIHLTEKPTEKDLTHPYLIDYKDVTKWELTDIVSNKFNRLILYDATTFHKSLDYFGKELHDGRLFQVFFFNTQN
jgi:hypothetical protein